MRTLLVASFSLALTGAALVVLASPASAQVATSPPPPPPPTAPTMPTPLQPLPPLAPPPATPAGTADAKPPTTLVTSDPIEPMKLRLVPPQTPSMSSTPPKKSSKDDDVDYTTRRYEPAGLPLLGGDSDIGFQFGGVATLSHFADGIRPYAWNMDVVASVSIKDGPQGVQLVQESFLYNADLPGYFGGKLRLNPQVQYQRTINMGYFGRGDIASGVVPANYSGPPGRYFEWVDSVFNGYLQPRYKIRGPWDLTGAVGFRYLSPTAYADSKLVRDSMARNPDGTPFLRGLQPLSITQLAVGTIYDSRDNEVFVHEGAFGQLGVAYQQAFPTSAQVQYGEAQALIQVYRPIGPFTLAARAVADFQFGHVPFYDLFMSGPFGQSEAIGGGSAIRGVPIGRYSGEIKLYGTVELRSMFFKFHVWKQKVTLGADALFDTGRSWSDYSFSSALDGDGIGLKYGAGGGIYVLWGQAAIFRIDAAYSPDARAENPSFPIGLYVADGTMF